MTSADEGELLDLCQQRRPDLVVLGLDVNNSLALITHLRRTDPALPILVTGDAQQGVRAAQAVAAGARGFLRHDTGPHRRDDSAWESSPADVAGAPALTHRELEVLVGMSEGKSNGEIGRQYFLSEDTIKTHARRLFRKLGAQDRAQAVVIGFRRRLLS